MPRTVPEHLQRTFLTIIAATVCGALAGAIAGWTVSPAFYEEGSTKIVDKGPSPTSTTPAVTVIPVDRILQPSLIPSPFAERRSSSVASLYRREKGNRDGLLTEDQVIAQAVAVTSDGWFVVPATAIGTLRLADMLVWHDGVSATPTRAVLDRLSGVVFIKTDLSHANAPAFARTTDVTSGLAVWLERRARRFEPSGIVGLFEPLASLDGVSSEASLRRGILPGVAYAGDRGAPVWSSNGALIGLVSSGAGEPLRYLPSSSWTGSLSSLLANGEVRHALLGARSVNVAWAHGDDSSRIPQGRGAWLREDIKGKKPAVDRISPAATAGLRSGDVIRQIDRDIMDESADLGELLAGYYPGSKVTLVVDRAGTTLEIPVELGSVVTSEELK